MQKRGARLIRLLGFAAGMTVPMVGVGAQAPVVTKAGVQAVIIHLVGRRTPTTAEDTTEVFAGREEMQRFVARVQAERTRRPTACVAGGAKAPTLGGTANGWTIQLTCEGAAGAEQAWRLVYLDEKQEAAGRITRTATLGSAAEADAWIAQVDTLVRGARVIRLKPLPRAP